MTHNLFKAGCRIKGWNRTPDSPLVQSLQQDSAVTIVDSIEQAVKDAQIIFTCVGDVPDVEEVLFSPQGIVQFAQPDALIVDFSTIGSKAVQEFAQRLQTHQLRFLDAPISGGDIGAQQGTLTIMVGGDRDDFELCLPYLEILGKNITYCGATGSGQAIKLCNQVLASLTMVGICEAVKLAQAQGIDPNLIVEVCSTGAAGSWALSNLGNKLINADYEPGFMIKHILKDLRLVGEALTEEQKLPGVDLAEKMFQIAAQLNEGEGYTEGTQAMIKSYLQD